MSETIENYAPQTGAKAKNKTGLTIWLVLFFLSVVWVALIIAPPLMKHGGMGDASSNLYYFFSFLCHQIPSRSFHIYEDIFAVCSRCFGVYLGIVLGLLFYPLFRSVDNTDPMPRVWLILACVPLGIDWSLTFFGIWENTHLTRFLTGALVGGACAIYILPAMVEIAGWLLKKKRV